MKAMLGCFSVLVFWGFCAEAHEICDNPNQGVAPCMVLNIYQTGAGEDDQFDAIDRIENICARSVEVSLCFPYVQPVDIVDRHYANRVVGPWARSIVEVSDLPAKSAGPAFQWR